MRILCESQRRSLPYERRQRSASEVVRDWAVHAVNRPILTQQKTIFHYATNFPDPKSMALPFAAIINRMSFYVTQYHSMMFIVVPHFQHDRLPQ